MLEALSDFDHAAFFWLNAFARQSLALDTAIVFFASILPYIMIVGVGIALLVLAPGSRLAGAEFFTAIMAALVARIGVASPIRFFWPTPRPYVEHQVHQLVTWSHAATPSFPSGHAIFLFAFAAAVFFHHRAIGTLALLAAGLTAIARVMAGVHYPSDVLAGAILGIAVGQLAGWILSRATER